MCHFLGKFSRISGSKRSLAVCTTVVQLGILRLTRKIHEFHTKIVQIRHFLEVKITKISQILLGSNRLYNNTNYL